MGHIDTENKIVEKEKELKLLIADRSTVEQAKLLLQRQKLELQVKIKDLEIASDKAKHNVKQQEIDLELLRKQFWSEKNSGS
jgi:hypothetical protein